MFHRKSTFLQKLQKCKNIVSSLRIIDLEKSIRCFLVFIDLWFIYNYVFKIDKPSWVKINTKLSFDFDKMVLLSTRNEQSTSYFSHKEKLTHT